MRQARCAVVVASQLDDLDHLPELDVALVADHRELIEANGGLRLTADIDEDAVLADGDDGHFDDLAAMRLFGLCG